MKYLKIVFNKYVQLGYLILFDREIVVLLLQPFFYFKEFQLLSERQSDNQTITITITLISAIETNDHTRIKMINLLLHNCLGHLGLKSMNQNFYDLEAKVKMFTLSLH